METKPTYEQAQLHLQVYEQRREARLREGRDWFFKNYQVATIDDAMRIAAPGTDGSKFAGMVLSYWEQVKAIVPQARERFKMNGYLAHMEKAAKRYEAWSETHSPGHIAAMREFMKQMRSQMAKAA